MMFERNLIYQGHSHRFVVKRDVSGWDVREEQDSVIIREKRHNDWHRVERELRLFEDMASALEKDGWARLP